MTISANGTYKVKFRAFHKDLWTIKGTIKESYSYDLASINFTRYLVTVSGVDIVLVKEGSDVSIRAMFAGATIFAEHIKTTDLKAQTWNVKMNNVRGVTTDITVTLTV